MSTGAAVAPQTRSEAHRDASARDSVRAGVGLGGRHRL